MNQDKLDKLSNKNKDILKRAYINLTYQRVNELVKLYPSAASVKCVVYINKMRLGQDCDLGELQVLAGMAGEVWGSYCRSPVPAAEKSARVSFVVLNFAIALGAYSNHPFSFGDLNTVYADADANDRHRFWQANDTEEYQEQIEYAKRWQINLLDRLLRIQGTQTMLRWRFEEKHPLLQIREEMSYKRMPGELTKLQEMFMIEGEGEKMMIWDYISQHKRSWKKWVQPKIKKTLDSQQDNDHTINMVKR